MVWPHRSDSARKRAGNPERRSHVCFRPQFDRLEDRTVPSGADFFANATVLTGSLVSVTGSNTEATGEFGEPDHVGGEHTSIPLNSVWWRWTAPNSGRVSIDTIGSNFDTTLAVYTAQYPPIPTVNHLNLIASNDDVSGPGGPSQVSFVASAGTTYHIAVDGWSDQKGDIVLNVSAAGAQLFSLGGEVTVTVLDPEPDTLFTSDSYLYSPPGPEGPFYLATTVGSWYGPSSGIGTPINLGTIAARTELVFGIAVRDTGHTLLMGPGSRNFDSTAHAIVTFVAPGIAEVGFEDLDGGGDFDYDDVRLRVEGVTINHIPQNTVPGPQTGAEDVPLPIGGLAVSDPEGGPLEVTLRVNYGTLTVEVPEASPVTVSGNGTGTVRLLGTADQINAVLASLTYLGNKDWSGTYTLTITTSDLGSGFGPENALSTTDAINITLLSSGQQAYQLTQDIQDLVASGTLNSGQGNSLITKLQKSLENPHGANQVTAFINEVLDWIANGLLTPLEGEALLAAAETLRLSLG